MEILLFGKKYNLTVVSDKGPRSDNQDSAAWIHFGGGYSEGNLDVIPIKDNPETFIAIVCDGMGGLENGSKISARVCEEFIIRMASSHYENLESFIDIISSLLVTIEDAARKNLPNSGTTIAAVISVDDQWCIMHLGDSRVYHGLDRWMRTLDHSPVESLLSKGLIDEEEALEHPMRNVVSKYMGGGYAKDLEIERIEPNEKVVLCSDGAFGYMPHLDFIKLISETTDASTIVSKALEKGSKDNTTVLYLSPVTQ